MRKRIILGVGPGVAGATPMEKLRLGVQVRSSPLTFSETMSETLNLSEPLFPHL